jgi:hypothetical protein
MLRLASSLTMIVDASLASRKIGLAPAAFALSSLNS